MDDPFEGLIGRSDTEPLDRDDFEKARDLIRRHGAEAGAAAERHENWHRTHGGYLQALTFSRVRKAIAILQTESRVK